jgi:hypothetical protein
LRARRPGKLSKTVNEISEVTVEFIRDESAKSEDRIREATEMIFQMILLARKRGRPTKKVTEEDNAA